VDQGVADTLPLRRSLARQHSREQGEGETSVSPKTPTAPPFGLTSAWVDHERSLSWNAPLEQLMLRTTGSMAPFTSASTWPSWNDGVSQAEVEPWPRCAIRKRPSFHAADMSGVDASQANVGFFSAAGRSVPSLNLCGSTPSWG
jgi:hypothetical protein